MGSKKKKQSPKKPVPASPAVDPVNKKRLDLARKLYREKVRSLNSMSKLAPVRWEAMDYDEIRAKRRMTAAVNLFDQVAAVARPICPDVEGVSDFEYEWLAHNMMPRISFDWNERVCNTVLAAAMWILDQLREYGCFHDACLLFSQDERIFEELDLPDIWDTSHDEDAQGSDAVVPELRELYELFENAYTQRNLDSAQKYYDKICAEFPKSTERAKAQTKLKFMKIGG